MSLREMKLSIDLVNNSEQEDEEYGMFGCCATCAIFGFPSDVSFNTYCSDDKELREAKDLLVKRIHRHCDKIVKMTKSIASATVNSYQTIAAECLEEAGFVSPTGWCHRKDREATQVKAYIKAVYKETKTPERRT